MSIELWLAFVVASAALLAAPGPTILVVVSHALGHGRSTGWYTVPGVALGDFTAITASLLGAGAVLATSATLFTILKYIGAAYLIWLGIKLWRTKTDFGDFGGKMPEKSNGAMFWNAYIVTALNPKGIIFFVAFVPQFIDPTQAALPQFIILESTFLVMATINVALWAVAAGQLQSKFQRPGTLKLINRLGASFLIGAGLLTAALRR